MVRRRTRTRKIGDIFARMNAGWGKLTIMIRKRFSGASYLSTQAWGAIGLLPVDQREIRRFTLQEAAIPSMTSTGSGLTASLRSRHQRSLLSTFTATPGKRFRRMLRVRAWIIAG